MRCEEDNFNLSAFSSPVMSIALPTSILVRIFISKHMIRQHFQLPAKMCKIRKEVGKHSSNATKHRRATNSRKYSQQL